MGLFRMNYNRPGYGIEKDAPPQRAAPRFFSIFSRKFFELVKLNLLFCIPAAVAFGLVFLLQTRMGSSYLTYLPLLLLSPFFGGLTIVTRNYAREEHAFIFYDFKNGVKNNWKAFLLNGVVCYLLMFILSFSVRYYMAQAASHKLLIIPSGICFAISMLLLFGQYYVPVMIVTFDLNLKQIYKNALIFSIAGLGRNILLTVGLSVLFLALYLMQSMVLTAILAFLFIVFLLFSLVMLIVNFAVYPLIDKMMIQPYLKAHPKQKKAEGEGTDPETDEKR